MENSQDSSSDSDSNSSNSWIFVYDNANRIETSANTFHLDCWREPIQELTEQDLLSANSDVESDTDGVSVISESELSVDDQTNTDVDNLITTHTQHIPENSLVPIKINPLKLEKKIFKHFNIFGVSVVIAAVCLAWYNLLLTKFNVPDDDTQTNNGMAFESGVVKESDSEIFYKNKNLYKYLDTIIDMTLGCANSNSKRDVQINSEEIKKCVKKNLKDLNTLNNNEFQEGIKISCKNYKQAYNNNYINKNKYDNNYNAKKKHSTCKNDGKNKLYKKNKFSDDNKTNTNQKKKDEIQYSKKYHNFKENKIKKNKDKTNLFKNKQNEFKYKYFNKNSDVSKTPKGEKTRNLSYINAKHNLRTQSKKVENNTDGEWYSHLHAARNEIRRREHLSDWVFDRASLRNKKRNKAQWYFKWMNVREQLRYKQGYKPYSS